MTFELIQRIKQLEERVKALEARERDRELVKRPTLSLPVKEPKKAS